MDDDDLKPKTQPAADRPPPRPPRRTAVGLGPDDDEPEKKGPATITKVAVGEGKFLRQTSGRGQYGHVLLRVEPNGKGRGIEIVSDVSDDVLPKDYVQSVAAGIRAALDFGIFLGDSRVEVHQMVDMVIHVIGGTHHPVDSSDIAFRMAGPKRSSRNCHGGHRDFR